MTVETTAAFDPAASFQSDARVAVRRKAYADAFRALGRPDGSLLLTAESRAPAAEAAQLGIAVADDLLAQGAADILAQVYGR